jgi:hypothetical protein
MGNSTRLKLLNPHPQMSRLDSLVGVRLLTLKNSTKGSLEMGLDFFPKAAKFAIGAEFKWVTRLRLEMIELL